VIAFLDPLSVIDAGSSNPMNQLQAAAGSGASLDKLLKAWGLEFDMSHVVSDKRFATDPQGPNGLPQPNPSFLSLTQSGMNTNEVATTQLGRVILPLAGHFTGTPAEGLRQTVLFQSTTDSQLTDKMMAQFGATEEFNASGTRYKIALRLEGNFKSAFPDGRPSSSTDSEDDSGDAAGSEEHLKEATAPGRVVLVGDADMLHQQFFVRIQNLFGNQIMLPPFAAN